MRQGSPTVYSSAWSWALASMVVAAGLASCASDSTSSADEGRFDDAPESQAAILADGDVTASEYEQSVLSVISCIREAGFEAGGPEVDQQDPTLLNYWTESEVDEQEQVGQVVANCESEHFDLIELQWAEQNYDPDADSDEIYELAVDCLEDKLGLTLDVDVSESSQLDELIDKYPTDYGSCIEASAEQLGT